MQFINENWLLSFRYFFHWSLFFVIDHADVIIISRPIIITSRPILCNMTGLNHVAVYFNWSRPISIRSRSMSPFLTQAANHSTSCMWWWQASTMPLFHCIVTCVALAGHASEQIFHVFLKIVIETANKKPLIISIMNEVISKTRWLNLQFQDIDQGNIGLSSK